MTAVAVAAATALTTSGLLSDASRARAEWKPTVDVMVTTHQISAGNDLADVTALERWPAALAPVGPWRRSRPGLGPGSTWPRAPL